MNENDFLILLQAKLDEAKSKGNVNADIDKIQGQLDKLKVRATLDPKSAQNLADEIGKLINQKIVISNIGIDTNAAVKSVQQTGKQMTSALNKEMSSATSVTNKVLRDFSELNDAKRKFVDGHDLISKDDIADAERLYDTVRKAFSEFGRVTVSKGSMNDGSLENMRVKIEQVNGEMKITRDFMLYFNESKNGFKLVDDDTIRTTEKMIQHLNEEKNIVNATNEEANAIKVKLAEQEKYYKNIKNEVNTLYSLKTKLLSADELQTAELEKQIKQTKERISYNNKQIDKKDLRDNSLDRQINDLEVAKQKQLDLASAKSQDVTNIKELAQAEKEATAALKERQSIEAQVNKIQLLSNGGIKDDYSTQIAKIEGNFRSLGFTEDEIQNKTSNITKAFDTLKTRVNQPFDESNYQEIISLNDKLQKELIESSNEYTKLQASAKGFVSVQQRLSKANTIEAWNQKNSAATKQTIATNEAYIISLRDLNTQMTKMHFNEISDEFKKTENSMRSLGKLGASFKEQMSQAAQSFTQWLSVSSGIMILISKARNAVSELKEINTILTEISKTADQLSKTDLSNLGRNAFSTASKYGKKAPDYLTGIQEMYRAGYENSEDLAELSTLAQAAGDMEADLANDYLIATDAAYKLKGNTKALNEVLDGQNYITNRNALSMKDLAEATKIAASQSASSGIAIDKSTAAMGTMIATTRQGGDIAARAWKGILMNLQQVEGEVEDGEILDAESLSKYEKACEALGVSLKEVKDGIISLRDPMQILEELSKAYTSLDESDARRANLISAVGGKYRGNQLNALLENWSLYEKMLKDYASGSGSAMEEAMKSANNWEGSMNRLGNTFTKVVNNIVNSDGVIAVANGLNKILSIVDTLTSKLGTLGTLSTIGSGFASANGLGLT